MGCKKVIIHDAAWPNVSHQLIKKIIYKLKKKHAVVPLIKINDATKRVKKIMIFNIKNIESKLYIFIEK